MALTKTPIINTQLDTMNHLLGSMVRQKMSEAAEVDLEEVAKNVRRGIASEIYDIGDQIIVPWTDTNGTEYQVPFDIVHFGEATLEYGDVVPAMYLQSHYAFPNGVQFDQNEALYYCSEALTAGTYYFTVGTTWGFYTEGTTIQFTLTKDVPAGGQLVPPTAMCGATSIDTFKITTYADSSSSTAIETDVQCAFGSDGTSLGTLEKGHPYSTSGLNDMHRCNYGYNRWSQSAIRQYFNSNAAKTAWWTPKNNYDRPPEELSSLDGFMKGFGDDFLSVLKPIKVTTLLNLYTDTAIGTSEDTYDTFFLPSKRNMNFIEQLEGVEGDIWDYWRRATKGVKPEEFVYGAMSPTYALVGHTAVDVKLRSPQLYNAMECWRLSFKGLVSGNGANSSNWHAPACAIC